MNEIIGGKNIMIAGGKIKCDPPPREPIKHSAMKMEFRNKLEKFLIKFQREYELPANFTFEMLLVLCPHFMFSDELDKVFENN